MQKSFPSVLSRRVCPVSLRMHSKSSQRKPAKHNKTSGNKFSERTSVAFTKNNLLEARKGRFGIRKKVSTHKTNYSLRHQSIVLIWSSLFLSLLLCSTTTTSVWILKIYKAGASKISS